MTRFVATKLEKSHIFLSQILFLEINGAHGYTIRASKGSASKGIHLYCLIEYFSRAILLYATYCAILCD